MVASLGARNSDSRNPGTDSRDPETEAKSLETKLRVRRSWTHRKRDYRLALAAWWPITREGRRDPTLEEGLKLCGAVNK